ncbi:MAG: hypothetical protein H3C50_02480 [Kiritimatiellae bacterium]|nr:hypothetical protein [Kiritimatiellia bacterium]MCO5061048.1 hypothetical protein [Kiritimatiellia bacterium]MCO5067895.1 hypothetical protein [Kiritimatiellia bacterium]
MDTFFFNLTSAQAATFLGALGVFAGVAMIAIPEATRAFLIGFGRNRTAAWILAAVDLLWAAWLVYHTPMERLGFLKPALYPAVPIAFYLIITYMDDLLATRALGGLLLLMANPILLCMRWLDTDWRYLPIVLAYVWAVAGMALVLSPYIWRRWAAPLLKSNARCRAVGILKLVGGALFLWLARQVF